MFDTKAYFTFLHHARRVDGGNLAHIALGDANRILNHRLRGGRVALQFVIDANYSTASQDTAALCWHFCHPREAHPGFNRCANVLARFSNSAFLPKGGLYE